MQIFHVTAPVPEKALKLVPDCHRDERNQVGCVSNSGGTLTLAERNSAWATRHNGAASGSTVLIVEDSETDIFFLIRALSRARVRNPVVIARSGHYALRYLKGDDEFGDRERFPFPGVVFLDLKMPAPDGFAILRWKSANADLPKALWVAMSNFDAVRAINEAYKGGASTFLTKPLDFRDVQNLIQGFAPYWEVHRKAAEAV